MPQHDAGQRIEPPVSVPGAAATMPAASAAAEPPLEPPGTRVGIVRVPARAEVRVLVGRPPRQLVGGELGDGHRAGGREPGDDVGVAVGDVVAEERAAVGRRDAARVDQVLPPDRARRPAARGSTSPRRAPRRPPPPRAGARSSVTRQTAPELVGGDAARGARRAPRSPSARARGPARRSSEAHAGASRRRAEPVGLGRQRPALRQVGDQPPEERAELEGMAAAAAADDHAVDPIEYEVAVGRHRVEARLRVHRPRVEPREHARHVLDEPLARARSSTGRSGRSGSHGSGRAASSPSL